MMRKHSDAINLPNHILSFLGNIVELKPFKIMQGENSVSVNLARLISLTL